MIDDILTMIPGPVPVHRRILDRLAQPTISHVAPSFVIAYKQALANFKKVMMADNASPFLIGGGGTLAMEMALVNIMAPGERLLIISQGYFGDRFAQLARAMDISYDILEADWGKRVAPEQLQRQLDNGDYAAVTITHVDTSTGTRAPAAKYCEILRNRKELVILDGVCASAGEEEKFDEWGLDVLLTAPQKAFAAPPGLAMILFSQRALQKRESLEECRAYYADIKRWQNIMENPGAYYSTPPVNQLLAFLEATTIILEEGLQKRFDRHEGIARAIRAGFAALGIKPFTSKESLANTLSLFSYPDGIDDMKFRSTLAENGVVVAGCLGQLAGKGFRVGHMGNIGAEEVCKTLRAAEITIEKLTDKKYKGLALEAAAKHLSW